MRTLLVALVGAVMWCVPASAADYVLDLNATPVVAATGIYTNGPWSPAYLYVISADFTPLTLHPGDTVQFNISFGETLNLLHYPLGTVGGYSNSSLTIDDRCPGCGPVGDHTGLLNLNFPWLVPLDSQITGFSFTADIPLHYGIDPDDFSRTISSFEFDLNDGLVPEPETWALMLIGFALLGFTARRQLHPEFG